MLRRANPKRVGDATAAALERTEAVLSNVGDGVFSTDPSGAILLWNRSAERVIGCTTKRALGRGCAAVLGLRVGDQPLDCSEGCALMRHIDGQPAGTSIEATRTRGDGREQPLLINITPIRDRDGTITEFVHSMRDITSIKQADEAKTMFLATASHELKTPLTVILGYTQILQNGWLDDDKRTEALDSIERRALELSRIVDRLLLTGRIEGGHITLSVGVIGLDALLTQRADDLITATGRTIELVLPDDLPKVVADPDGLTTVLDHLLENAIKYSPDGGSIIVQARGNRSSVEIEITDFGIGMDDEAIANCFDRFWQAESSDVRRFGGTGVGLYIVRSLVEAMGGTIVVRSVPDEGTTFTIRLRRATDADVALGAKAEPEPGVGKRTMIQEFMQQIGVPSGGGGGS